MFVFLSVGLSCGLSSISIGNWRLDDRPLTRRFKDSTAAIVKDVAKELKLDWHSVKDLHKQYMKARQGRKTKT